VTRIVCWQVVALQGLRENGLAGDSFIGSLIGSLIDYPSLDPGLSQGLIPLVSQGLIPLVWQVFLAGIDTPGLSGIDAPGVAGVRVTKL
jgi:hypothetical protein